ncbi:hypothetical protein WL81_24820 [Burkholderia ubonensis]|nr:hypothetical protein WK73_09455 [Burkholderia ubonensis]KWE85619.1 hypothetical protein WL81_24820 [Burkholderia ubonensis]
MLRRSERLILLQRIDRTEERVEICLITQSRASQFIVSCEYLGNVGNGCSIAVIADRLLFPIGVPVRKSFVQIVLTVTTRAVF